MIKKALIHLVSVSFILVMISGCLVPKTLVSLPKKLITEVDDNDDDVVVDGSLIAALTGPINPNSLGFCFYHNPTLNYCWGEDLQLGTDTSSFSLVPAVLYGKTIKKFALSSGYHNCVVASDDKLYCWGDSLGNGTTYTTQSDTPVAVDTSGVLSGKIIKDVYTGYVSCALDSTDKMYCWGNNTFGGIGDGTIINRSSPVAVSTAGVLSGKSIKKIGMSSVNTFVIASDDKIYSWGSNNNGSLGSGGAGASSTPVAVTIPGGLTVKSIAPGDNSSCAIASDDNVYCWGMGASGIIGNGSFADQLAPVAVDTTGVLAGKTVKSLSVKGTTACVVASDDHAYCWGTGTFGQLGDGNGVNSNVPVAVSPSGVLNGLTIKNIFVFFNNTCAIASDDHAYCFGKGVSGENGDGTSANTLVPTAVVTTGALSGKTIKTMTGKVDSVCAIGSDDEIYCWGDNSKGQLGNETTIVSNVPTKVVKRGALVGKTFKEIRIIGNSSYCALASDDFLYCWGRDFYMGLIYQEIQTYPVSIYASAISGSPVANQIFLHNSYDGRVHIQDNLGNVYSGYPTSQYFQYSLGSIRIKKIFDSRDSRYCFLDTNDIAYCLGSAVGKAGISVSNFPEAVEMSGVLNGLIIQEIAYGYSHACALASDKKVYCWGNNSIGQLGNASNTDSLTPVTVDFSGALSGLTVKTLTVLGDTTCVIASNNLGYCWGSNGGLFGNGSLVDSNTPVSISMTGALNGKILKYLTLSYGHACVIADDLKPYCWGAGSVGQLGNGAFSDTTSPVAVDTSGVLNNKNIKGLGVGNEHTCVIASDDKVYCWGANSSGQLGDGSVVDSAIPVAVTTSGVLSGKTIKNLAVGEKSNCVIASDNNGYCWGENGNHQLGDNTATSSSVPIAILYAP